MKHVLQIKATLLQNGVDITKWDNSYYKVGQAIHYEKWVNNYKVGKILQSGATLLQNGEGFTKCANYMFFFISKSIFYFRLELLRVA